MIDKIYPKIKPFVEFCWRNGTVSFFRTPGFSINLVDDSKFIFNVCRMMDGLINLNELQKKISEYYPFEAQFLSKLIDVLDKERLIEFSQCQKTALSLYEIDRWSRNIEFFGAYCKADENKYDFQKALINIKVIILGLGGVGSNVLINLAALGVKNISIVDFDTVCLSNLNRQFIYQESDLGAYKCEAAKVRILDFLPTANINQLNRKILSEQDAKDIIRGHDIVIAAADLPRDKILDWINSSCVEYKIPFICGGIDSRWATYFSIIPGLTGCMECWKLKAKSSGPLFQEIVNTENFSSAVSPNVAIMPMISIVAGLISNEFLKIISGISKPSALGRLCVFDFKSADISVKEFWKKDKLCKVCNAL